MDHSHLKRKMKLKVGDTVEFIGCSKEQIQWGNNDDTHHLTLGCIYTITDVDVHRYHTKIKLSEITGKFNSVCFKLVD